MTVIAWPAKRAPRRPRANRNLIVDPLPTALLHSMVANLPGPKHETEPQRAVRFEAQLAEVLSYDPRNSADAMLATHCTMMRLLADDARQDAAQAEPANAKKCLRSARECDKLLIEVRQTLARRQASPLRKMDPARFIALGMEQVLIPDPEDTEEEAFSAIIVPLHPAPKMLQ
jgi:hypothetical protein